MQWRLIVDFGLVILIWMTQLVVYPSFTFFDENDLVDWHGRYTTAISVIVMPLMLSQVALHGFALFQGFSWLGVFVAILIALIWINTFLFAVPLHNQITAQNNIHDAAVELVRINWYRTVLWTLVFLLSLYDLSRN